jgi:FHS family L-fucose permease-like MFS transporter
MTNQQKPNYLFPMIVMSVLFFMVGFITTMNNSLIAFLEKAFHLGVAEKQLINSAFYGAYLFSIPLALIVKKMGYKPSAVLSLAVIGGGFFLCFPAVAMGYYPFLCAMFVVALGIALLQIVLNPYVLALGPPETAASRLNITGTLNSLATVFAPLFVGQIIVNIAGDGNNPTAVQWPFVGIAALTLLLCIILYFLKLPVISDEEAMADGKQYKKSPFSYPHLIFGAIAIFAYMGVEVGIPSFLPDRIKTLQLDIKAEDLLPFYWGGLLAGRFLGSFLLTRIKARTALTACVLLSAACLAVSLCTTGYLSIYLMIGTGLFHSIMWANIFNLAIEDLGPHAKVASGIVCTCVIGGAILPPLMGMLQQGFVHGEGDLSGLATGTVAAICCLFVYYIYIGLFSGKLSRIRPK